MKYSLSSTGSIFSSTLLVELDLYEKILPRGLSNTGEYNFHCSSPDVHVYMYMSHPHVLYFKASHWP